MSWIAKMSNVKVLESRMRNGNVDKRFGCEGNEHETLQWIMLQDKIAGRGRHKTEWMIGHQTVDYE